MAWSVPSNVSAGTTILDTTTNAILGDLTIIGQSWPSYTPTTTNITLGNGSVVGRANVVNKTADFTIVFTMGSTSAILGAPTFTLPATANAADWVTSDCAALDNSAAAYYPFAAIAQTTTVVTMRPWPGTAGNNFGIVSSTVPFTWATNDKIYVTGRFEVA